MYLSLFCPVVEFRGKTGGTKWKVNRTSTSMFTVNLEWTFLKATSNKIRSCSQFVRTLAFGNFFAGCSSYWGGLATKLGRLRLPKPPRGAGAAREMFLVAILFYFWSHV